MPDCRLDLPRVGETADDAYASTLQDVLDHGSLCQQGAGLSIGSGRESREILNYAVVISSPRERLIFNKARKLNLPAAVARFVWMMAASDRLADIAFYEDKVRGFSDDGLAVPGSNYGQRMLRPRPGLNQLESVIRRLKEDPGSRRAAISIYQAEDAVRDSKDIPCTFGLFYHVRDEQLISTTIMRSNNAYILLPYNIFEFSLLAEVVAVEVGVPLGPLTHHAMSMHVYSNDYAKAREVVDEWLKSSAVAAPIVIPRVPSQPAPLGQINKLAILETELRHGSAGLRGANVEHWIAKGAEQLHPFWSQHYFLLLLHVAQKNQDQEALSALESVLQEPWRSYLPTGAFVAHQDSEGARLVLMKKPMVPLYSTRAMESLKARAAEWERKEKKRLDWEQYAKAQEVLLDRLAARGGEGFNDEISSEEFDRVIKVVTSGNA